MTKATAKKVISACSTDEVQKWSSNIGKFVTGLQPHLLAVERAACGSCPFRNKSSMGGCIAEECPIHIIRHSVNRAVPRAAAAVKEIYKAKYARS